MNFYTYIKGLGMNLKLSIKALAILGITALILGGTSFGLSSLEKKYEEESLAILVHTLLPKSESYVEEEYTGEDSNIQKVYKTNMGYVIQTCTAGYVDDITMLVGVNNDGMVTGVVIREMAETYGLGQKAFNDVEFLAQFLKTSGEAEVGKNVDAVSGATVTSKAITRSVNSAVAFVTGSDISSGATSWGG